MSWRSLWPLGVMLSPHKQSGDETPVGSCFAGHRTTFCPFFITISKFSVALKTFCVEFSLNPDGARVKYLKGGFTGNSKAGLPVRLGLNLFPLTATSTPRHLICSLSSHAFVLLQHTLYSVGDKSEVRLGVEQNFGEQSSWNGGKR